MVEAVVAGLSDRIKSASVAFVVGRGKVEEPVGCAIHALLSVFINFRRISYLDSVDLAPLCGRTAQRSCTYTAARGHAMDWPGC